MMFAPRTMLTIARAVITKNSPYYVQFYINGTCNLKCRQCNIVETNSHIEAMSLDAIREVARNLRKVGTGIVLLTGGEPFMRKDLPEIVEAFTSLGMNVRLQTAGSHYATEDKLRACYEAGARDINVSLDSLDLATSDYINAVPGSGSNAINTIELISKVFRGKSAVLAFGTVLSAFNYREIPAILEFAARIGWWVSLVPVHISQKSPRGFRSYDADFCFREEEHQALDALRDNLLALKRTGAPLFDSERFLGSAIEFLKGKPPGWRKNGVCDSPNLYFTVRPNGDFTTCCDYVLSSPPNLRDQNFPKIYPGLRSDPKVQKITKGCEGCHYGSYPEVTLSVRDPKAFLERVRLTLFNGTGRLSRAPIQEDFLGETRRIAASKPDIYPRDAWARPELQKKIRRWADQETRKRILAEDLQSRKEQGRQRGVGPDPIIEE